MSDKKCNRCLLVLPIDSFPKDRSKADGHRSICKSCKPKPNADYIKAYVRNRNKAQLHLWGKFRITPVGYAQLLSWQGDCCAICKRKADTLSTRLGVDHDHSCCPGSSCCGTCIRGLLCRQCNAALGGFQDSIEILENALAYLKEFKHNE